MEPKIRSLSIERFRALRRLKIEGLGRVNLITGKNNTGKSSVLEALRILASDASPTDIGDILRFREEVAGQNETLAGPFDTGSFFPLSSLFSGFPRISPKPEPILISSVGRNRTMDLSLEAGLLVQIRTEDGSRRFVPLSPDSASEDESFPGLMIRTSGITRTIPLDIFLSDSKAYPLRGRLRGAGLTDEPRLPCEFVSPYGGERTYTLGRLWDKVALSDREKDVVDALRIIDANIMAVSMIGGEGPSQSRTAIVRSINLPRPVPLRSFGDGLNRLFGIILALVNAKDGLLLIDEFENGMHYSVQADAWRAIFRLATRLDIQVVATSHSWDAIEAFQKAASETPEEGVLIRLSRKGEDIIPTLFREDELAIATRDRIEVR